MIYNDQIKGLEKRPDLYGAYEVDGTGSNNQIDASETINPSSKFKGTIKEQCFRHLGKNTGFTRNLDCGTY